MRGTCLVATALALWTLSAYPAESATTSSDSATSNADIRIRVIDAQLPLVLETLAANAGLDARMDATINRRSDTISETLIGSSEDALRRIAEEHDLAVFIDGGTVWIDDINRRHSATIMSSSNVANRVYDVLVAEPVMDEGVVKQSGGSLELTGSRAFVQLTSRRAGAIIEHITDGLAAQADTRRPEPIPPAVIDTLPTVQDVPAVDNADGAEIVPVQEITVDVVEPVLEIRPSSRGRAPIRSITDVPGFDTEYTK